MVNASNELIYLKDQFFIIAFGVVWQIVAIYHVVLASLFANDDINTEKN
jgi:hypothetical protein